MAYAHISQWKLVGPTPPINNQPNVGPTFTRMEIEQVQLNIGGTHDNWVRKWSELDLFK